MGRFAEDSLSKKILVLFITTTTVLILQGLYNIYSMNDVNTSIRQVHDSVYLVHQNNQEISYPVSELRQLTMFLVMAPDANTKHEIITLIDKDIALINSGVEREIQNSNLDSTIQNLSLQIKDSWLDYRESVLQTLAYSNEGIRIAEFMHITTDAKSNYDKLIADVDAYNNHLVALSDEIYIEAQDNSKWAFWAVIVTTVTEAIILKIILFYVLNLVKKRLDERKQHALELVSKNDELQNNIKQLQSVQNQLIEAEKQASLSKLVAGVAHEINTPVGLGITTSTHLEDLTDNIEKKVKENTLSRVDLDEFIDHSRDVTRILISNLTRAAEIIQRFKRLSSDNIHSLLEKLNIGQKISDTLLALGPNMKGIEIKCENFQDIEVKTDSGAIYHTISNLVLNAKNHAFENIEHPTVTIRMEDYNDQYVRITVADNGNGIDEEDQNKIFDPFFSTNRENGGTGLGLSIVYNVLARIDGSINCKSKKGQGTIFTIDIPGPAMLVTE
ncbi:PAS/PAC sensor signal transduction histidine kinase [Vibrio orientalis CIP 102891 = ATCC 33934]|uniref:histidine kinase n=1 Tax=Vibrio orientalis CIP 102891 = ATCC 33934 TaxID=675816 RepID=C9QFG6_VIBOR|nr:ATP-binding protein [Vibrio orientalis]EEX94002.1 two-component sensor histidine kinase protein [Vibrio orientalis CIP 102891 = ATCC 33934]EGU52856.1 PAS/PAC sensor signal transduction histidine kinase [Vibrio orientalis CIP 102891 = ATCC 33934]